MDWEEQVREDDLAAQAGDNDKNYEDRISKIRLNDEIDKKFGFERYQEAEERSAYLINIQPSEIIDDQTKTVTAAVDFYFIQEDGSRFKIAYPFRPYFYIACLNDAEYQVATYLTKKYGNMIHVENVWKEDLDLKNHLSGIQRPYLKISFSSMVELGKLKRDLMPLIRKNKSRVKNESTYTAALARHMGGLNNHEALDDLLSQVIDIREHDLPYHMRVAIDEKIFVGKWYAVRGLGPNRIPQIKAPPQEILVPVEPVVMAFDIETTKLPLKFPDRNSDEIMMISYMIDGRGFLIINREIVSSDIESFEYTPKEEFKGEFHVWNEANEKAVIRRFFDHILTVQPNIIVTYNGDFFDWPFVETRADIHGLDMMTEIGFSKDSLKEYKSRNCIHMDAFRWVQRDSYLPVGSQNLKAVAKAKLRYDPVEVDPEKMCTMAREEPQNLANYSVSDAVATYYLYMKYVHPFVFALCTIIPLGPDDVLRKGSGTLCEALLMVEAFHNNIIFPNKYTGGEFDKTTKDGHRIELETYVGGHVEALEAGVFRADIPVRFRLVPTALARLQEEVPATIEKEMIREFGIERKQIVDFEERCAEIQEQFAELLAIPARSENPRIYHLDVGAMYPNIILTNRLQPCAMITEETCMSCCYNTPDAQCKRVMDWEWRGDIIPASKNEYQQIRQQLEAEFFDKPPKPFHLLEKNRREQIEKKRVAVLRSLFLKLIKFVSDYCRRVYGRAHVTRTEKRQTMICQRENAFYVDTVKAFRDRRYDYKEMLKKAKGELDSTPKDDVAGIKAAQARVVLYESLQLAHKCILNSFYGYVMRKGSRWFSMEMAGIVCYTGANIITEARKLVEQIGKPLELDTDGIWCLIPASFPENVTFQVRNHKRKSVTVSYPAAMLNALVFESFTNHQYHTLQEDKSYKVESTNSIYFEVDGPYQCMVLPASKEEGKKLKKRYAVFNLDGSLAELKGFELKRRGELNIIKYFQNSVFKTFLRGSTLEEVYGSVACDANHWLDILFDKGAEMSDSELFDLISENRSMSRKLDDYGAQKSTSISTAKRLAEFLGAEMVQDAGLACMFVISRYPIGAPVTERAIPVAIYQADPKVRLHYLRKWTKQPGLELEKCEIRELLDWDYYRERLGSCIQKIITIPAALQGVSNPVPRVPHPDWLSNKIKNRVDARKQPKITDIFEKAKQRTQETSDDVVVLGMKRKSMARAEGSEPDDDDDDNVVEKENQNPKKRPAKEKDVEKEPEKLVKKTLVDHGFQEWLRFLKQKWKLQRTQRKTLQSVSGVEKILRDTRLKTAEAGWQLLWLEETREPGYFNLWAAKEGQMRNFALKVDRAITVNYKTPIEGRSTVRRVLPHQQTPFHLYEYKSDETKFSALLDKLNAELCSAHVEGIYESQTPLALRALAHLGAISRTNTPPQSGVYNLESFSMIPLSESPTPYLPQGFLRTIFLYKYSKGNAHIWSVIDESMGEGHVLVSNPGQIDLPNVTRLYETLHEEEVKTNSTVESIRAQIQFKNYVFTSIKECCKEVHKILRIASQATTRPTIIVAVCDEAHRSMVQHVANISLFPFLRLHVVEPSALLNLPGWNRLLPSRIIRHFFNSFVYLQDYADWARYLHIPLCNMPSDPAMFAIDLFYTRHLTWASQTLWATASSRPDLGGKELDDLRLAVDWTPLTKDTATLINKPGFWGDSCIELELGFVAVTALVQRGRLLNAEGADDTVAFDSSAALPAEAVIGVRNTISAYDEGAAVDAAMKILKGMLSDCLREMAVTQNVRANEMLLGLSRWLHTPTALLYDPAITRSVTVLEKKMVLLLCTECERLGAKVIYASANRLILSTGKSSIDKALGFVQLLIESLDKNPLFASIVKQPIKAYRAMLWRDFYNFTGL
ncbi:hypothetical protein WR25_03570 [Diploscapter pachys]|uniref:DNA polymerase epsilon catalytic subunit n=1 Tax=Diploscapter pachys TaxID=2018661 RepID=A0A2A2L2N7_9BILA|nr:hypothetical protein WR25_03570 [Diploscapter pachys]